MLNLGEDENFFLEKTYSTRTKVPNIFFIFYLTSGAIKKVYLGRGIINVASIPVNTAINKNLNALFF